MANGRFVHSWFGYRQTLNDHNAFRMCDKKGAQVCAAANAGGSGSSYSYDTIYGQVRIHTRVKTASVGAFYQEGANRKLHRRPGQYKLVAAAESCRGGAFF